MIDSLVARALSVDEVVRSGFTGQAAAMADGSWWKAPTTWWSQRLNHQKTVLTQLAGDGYTVRDITPGKPLEEVRVLIDSNRCIAPAKARDDTLGGPRVLATLRLRAWKGDSPIVKARVLQEQVVPLGNR
jgi:hypothetical protein